MMEMPRLLDEHRRLKALAGDWVGEETILPSPWDPKGGPAKGRAESRVAMDGFYVVTDYEQERGGRVGYRGHGVFGFDPKEQRWFMSWADSMGGMAPVPVWGTWKGDTLTFEAANPGCGHSRYVYRFVKDGEYTFAIQNSADGSTWSTFMDGKFRRK